mgnify:CR=1 FL=1
MKIYSLVLLSLFLNLIFLNVEGQTVGRDLTAEYCKNNWVRDPVRCVDYLPADYNLKKSEYQSQELQKLKTEIKGVPVESKEFEIFSAQIAKAEKELSDAQKRLRNLTDDAPRLKALTTVAQGIAGGFAAAQGAVALFGGENEELNKTLLKVQGSLALLNGVEAISNTFKKENALVTNLQTEAQALYTTVVGTSTGALKLFRIALAATGIGLVVVAIGELVAHWEDLTKWISGSTEALDKNIEATKRSTEAMKSQQKQMEQNIKDNQAREMAALERTKAIREAYGLDTIEIATGSLNNWTGSTFIAFSTSIDSRVDLTEATSSAQAIKLTNATESISTNSTAISANTNFYVNNGSVQYWTANAGSNTININTYTGQYDLINNGNYSNANNKLQDIVFVGDTISVNNEIKVVKSVGNNSLILTTDMTDDANTYLSVQRNFIANTSLLYDQIKIYGFVGQVYNNPQLMTEDGITITTEDGNILIVG